MFRHLIKKTVVYNQLLFRLYRKHLVNNGVLIKPDEMKLTDSEKVFLEKPIGRNIKVGLVKDRVWIDEQYISSKAYFPKYERFLKNNNIEYKYYDIHQSNWINLGKEFDLIIWHTASDPATQYIAKNKIYVLEKLMGKVCLPGYNEIWSYEDKINAQYVYEWHGLPSVPTFISNSKEEALTHINKRGYPFISKITTGSSSMGVDVIKSKKQAKRLINKVFGSNGRKTYFPYERQKNYVYFQDFIEGSSFDLRVIVVGEKLFGYYRYPKKGDFKASGSGIIEKKEIPEEALDIAYLTKQIFKSNFLATDLLLDKQTNKFFIIESSIFIGVDTCEQLAIKGTPGFYQRTEKGEYVFKEGKFWVQELTLKEVIENKFYL